MKVDFVRQLRRLAEMNGVQPSFIDAAGHRRSASPEALSALLQTFGLPVNNETEVYESRRATSLQRFRQGIEPVLVAWEKRMRKISFHVPAKLPGKPVYARLLLEDGHVEESRLSPCVLRANSVEDERFVEMQLTLPSLPFGYHVLEIGQGATVQQSLIVSAPIQSYTEPDARANWGAFLPMYAAHSEASWGAGNFSDWERLSGWIGSKGGNVAATLPLLAAFLDYPVCEPSPYSPASRLFWNEFYLDITRIPEFARCRAAREMVRSRSFQRELRVFRTDDLIDYAAQWKLRRSVLELLAKDFFSRTSSRHAEFERFLRERPEVEDYSDFRAACDKLKISWHNWPQHMQDGALHKSDFAEATRRFYRYIQWIAHEQIAQLVTSSESNGVKLYLDLPLGVNPDGYDVWRERENFVLGANAGAPPDMFFTKGQDWGCAPLHPQRIRESGYRYLRALLRFQMRHARLLRIDHVMGLHRLYWVPRGFEAGQGTYVNYAAEELQAIFNLESHRNRTLLVGENLGTVPEIVNQNLRRHRVREMFVVQFEERPDPKAALRKPPAISVASLNTHDTPTFVAHWRGDDLRDCFRRKLLTKAELNKAMKQRKRQMAALTQFLIRRQQLKKRSPRVQDVLEALLVWLRKSPSELILINLEDLWLETRPQNVPGTSTERPNWRRKASLTIEQMLADANVSRLVSQLRTRRGCV